MRPPGAILLPAQLQVGLAPGALSRWATEAGMYALAAVPASGEQITRRHAPTGTPPHGNREHESSPDLRVRVRIRAGAAMATRVRPHGGHGPAGQDWGTIPTCTALHPVPAGHPRAKVLTCHWLEQWPARSVAGQQDGRLAHIMCQESRVYRLFEWSRQEQRPHAGPHGGSVLRPGSVRARAPRSATE
ncbi:hypothetical protein GCM10010207_82010 [Streptomyces atratus]|nr:hypothetical protein GCM10010207_82010 [Streptomyces atratus]